MTTGWGDVGHWEAPRVAYEIAAEWAGEVSALSGGPGGHFPGGQMPPEPPPLGKQWHDLRFAERRDVLTAMAVQTRAAIYEVAAREGMTSGFIDVDVSWFAAKMCEQARGALAAVMLPEAPIWEVPECGHCAGLMATALVALHRTAIEATGVGDPAVVLRRMADDARGR